MNIEARLGVKSLNEIIEYFSKDNFHVDYQKYRFVLTDEEIYVLSEFINRYLEKKEFDYEDIASKLYYDMDLTKAKPDETIVARLLVIAYKKIKHVDSYYQSNEHFNNISLLEAMNINSENSSITLEQYNKLSNDGMLHASTSRLERFIIKYRLGMLHAYKYLSNVSNPEDDFYNDLAVFCHQLGYADRHVGKYIIDNILLSLNDYLVRIESLVEVNHDINEIDLATASVDKKLAEINKHFREQTPMPEFRVTMNDIYEKLDYIAQTSKPYLLGEIVNENDKRL